MEKKELTLTRVENRLCVALTGKDNRVSVYEKDVCVTLFELEGTDKLVQTADHDIDLEDVTVGDPHVKLIKTMTVAQYRDRFGQMPQAMIEQFDGDRFWFTSIGKARDFAGLHGLLEVPQEVMKHLRPDDEK